MYASLGELAETAIPCCWNQAILGISPDPARADQRFLKYALRSLRPVLRKYARSNTQANLNAEEVGNLPIPCPPLRTQHRIADVLDSETDRIGQVWQAKQNMLDLLNVKRQALYIAAVGGTLNAEPAREVPSSLPWLPSIPKHWRVSKLSLVAKLGTGHTPSRSESAYWNTDRDIPWITTGDIERLRDDRVDVLTDTRDCISAPGLQNSAAVLHPKGTVALSRTASVGFSAVMGKEMATSQDFVTWTCSDLLEPRFLLACLRAMRRDLVGRLAMGSTHKTIYMSDVESLRIPLPPVHEQRQIIDGLDRETSRLDDLLDLVERQVALLAERRDALITAAVTGQLDPSSYRESALTE